MSEALQPGLSGTSELVVGPENTARHLGSGGVDVLATPELVRLMERAAMAAVERLLPAGSATVGARIDVQHLAPSPKGMRVVARAELVAVEGRRLTFNIEVRDERELVGRGQHQRAIINVERFGQRLAAKNAG
ncbi:MAG TPA: thioesterase family protein [Anaerolineae bacterium]|nr:thioesterase family protein [Anaerolineae bacterium]HOQ97209.1 thioesterase family protein [Anaerolineae bacterium]HPL26435.1 thioesterase family protein [Anaerolineae bacterium]